MRHLRRLTSGISRKSSYFHLSVRPGQSEPRIDMIFASTRRPRSLPRCPVRVHGMHLAKVTPDNFSAAIALRVRDDQQDLVAPVVQSLAEAYLYPDNAWPRLIVDGD